MSDTVTLESLIEPGRSITYGVVKPGPEVDGGIRFVRGGDVFQGRIAIDDLRTISPDLSARYRRTLLRGGELLVSLVGNPGEAAVVPEELSGANIARQVGLVPVRSGVNPHFLMYYLRSPRGRAELFMRTQGAVQQVINLSDLRTVEVPVIRADIQERIVGVLSAYDDLIENNRRRIALLEEAARLLYREWFVHLRFPGHEHVAIRDGVPEGWERRQLRDVAEVNRVSLSRNFHGQIQYVDISSVTPGVINRTESYAFHEAPSRARRIVRHGDVIWSCVRPNRQSHAIVWNPCDNLIVSTGFAVLTPLCVPTSYLYQAVTTDQFVGYLTNRARGAAYPAVRGSDFENAELLIPCSSLLDRFGGLTEPLLAQAEALRTQSAMAAQARDLLLPRLMNGDIIV